MSVGLFFVLLALAVAAVLTIVSIVVSTTKGAGWGMVLWDDPDRAPHDRHARHQRDAEIRAARTGDRG